MGVMDPDDVAQEVFAMAELLRASSGPSCGWASAGPQSLELYRQLLVAHSARRQFLWLVEPTTSWLYETMLIDSSRMAKR